MSTQIQSQAAKVWQMVSDPQTIATYKNVAFLTWEILTETLRLLWLVLCLVLVVGDWIWRTGIQSGHNFRNWINGISQTSPDHLMTQTGQALLTVGKTSIELALSNARTQLGLPESLPSPEVVPPPPPTKTAATSEVKSSPAPASSLAPATVVEPAPAPAPKSPPSETAETEA